MSDWRISGAQAWLDQFDRVVASSSRHVPMDVLRSVATIARDQRERRAYEGTVLLVGLAGGTGSGKSSLLNALANNEVSTSGAMRPTTSEALAWVPSSAVSRLSGLFERFGISDIVTHDLDQAIAIVDLPDVDSVESRHRNLVAGLLPIIDLVVWVVDPEKYRDRVLHSDHLAPLASHQKRFRFVLNQVDRVDENDIDILIADFVQALAGDGIRDPIVWLAAADPPFGPPIGTEAIWDGLVAELASRRPDDGILVAELRRGLSLLTPHLQAVGFGPRWEPVKQHAAHLWDLGNASEAIRELRIFLIDLSAEAPGIDIDLDLDELIGSPLGDVASIARNLDATVGRYLRERLRARGMTRALADELALSLPRDPDS